MAARDDEYAQTNVLKDNPLRAPSAERSIQHAHIYIYNRIQISFKYTLDHFNTLYDFFHKTSDGTMCAALAR